MFWKTSGSFAIYTSRVLYRFSVHRSLYGRSPSDQRCSPIVHQCSVLCSFVVECSTPRGTKEMHEHNRRYAYGKQHYKRVLSRCLNFVIIFQLSSSFANVLTFAVEVAYRGLCFVESGHHVPRWCATGVVGVAVGAARCSIRRMRGVRVYRLRHIHTIVPLREAVRSWLFWVMDDGPEKLPHVDTCTNRTQKKRE